MKQFDIALEKTIRAQELEEILKKQTLTVMEKEPLTYDYLKGFYDWVMIIMEGMKHV